MLNLFCRAILTLAAVVTGSDSILAQMPEATAAAQVYSDEVVAKADAILAEAGMRRSGKTLTATAAGDLSRQLAALARTRRELRLQQTDLQTTVAQINELETLLRTLGQRDGELNLQLAAIASGDVTANNRIVAMINATRSQVTLTREKLASVVELVERKRGEVNQSESVYAEAVFQIRRTFDALRNELQSKLKEEPLQVAIRVLNANFEVPQTMNADEILRPLEKRLLAVEQEVFNETIPLTRQVNGSLVINVSVNGETVMMVVDSGASVVVLPSATAAKLNVQIPNDAPVRTVVLANGEKIASRGVMLQSVRVGPFEAEQIEAVVLGAEATNAEPLLGMSYLGRFKFELNSAEKSLKMLRVVTP